GGRVEGFRLGSTYTVGALPLWLWPQHYLADQPLAVLGLMLLAAFLVAAPLFWVLRRRAALRLRARTSR
ncbi:MAG: hypothetical protein NTW56_14820, partial [Alphaproteobacteria bacterium]|nr:hypothetical protein [Alphaproteobacteria bacterium]